MARYTKRPDPCSAPNNDLVLLVGNFGDGHVHAFDANHGSGLGQLTDPDGKPIQIDGLWALKVGNGGVGGAGNTVYFTAGLFDETHGLLGSFTTATPGSPEGAAEGQQVQAHLDIVQLDMQHLNRTCPAEHRPPPSSRTPRPSTPTRVNWRTPSRLLLRTP